jgi:hypothetical protein
MPAQDNSGAVRVFTSKQSADQMIRNQQLTLSHLRDRISTISVDHFVPHNSSKRSSPPQSYNAKGL